MALSSVVVLASAMSITRPAHASERNANLARFAFTGSFRFATRQPVIVLAAPHRPSASETAKLPANETPVGSFSAP